MVRWGHLCIATRPSGYTATSTTAILHQCPQKKGLSYKHCKVCVHDEDRNLCFRCYLVTCETRHSNQIPYNFCCYFLQCQKQFITLLWTMPRAVPDHAIQGDSTVCPTMYCTGNFSECQFSMCGHPLQNYMNGGIPLAPSQSIQTSLASQCSTLSDQYIWWVSDKIYLQLWECDHHQVQLWYVEKTFLSRFETAVVCMYRN